MTSKDRHLPSFFNTIYYYSFNFHSWFWLFCCHRLSGLVLEFDGNDSGMDMIWKPYAKIRKSCKQHLEQRYWNFDLYDWWCDPGSVLTDSSQCNLHPAADLVLVFTYLEEFRHPSAAKLVKSFPNLQRTVDIIPDGWFSVTDMELWWTDSVARYSSNNCYLPSKFISFELLLQSFPPDGGWFSNRHTVQNKSTVMKLSL